MTRLVEDADELSEQVRSDVARTAEWLFKNPDKKNAILERSQSDPKFRFLYEPNTREGRYYAQVSASLRVESEVKQICNDSSSVPTNTSMSAAAAAASAVAAVRSTSHPSAGTRVLNEGEDGSADARPEKRRNRWGPAVDGHLPQAPPPAADASESYQRSMPRDYTVALPETRDQASEQQLKVQREMQQLEQRIRDAAAEQKRAQMTPFDDLKEERRREYEMLASQSDEHRDTAEDADRNLGIIDGGTWEHRKRAREMLSTADGSDDLTELNRGKHHIAQFLPKEELDNFLKSADSVAKGLPKEEKSDFSKHKLDSSNMGFQMLQKAGWTEGSGLGAGGAGIIAPVSASAGASGNGHGVGVKDTHEVDQKDDEFDQYRKRMMLSYRFRPNPLNNPRRSYY